MIEKKLILVSGFNNYLALDENDIHNKLNPSYYVSDNEISKIGDYVGDNDPYIPQDALKNDKC